jgi:hypothetical protein
MEKIRVYFIRKYVAIAETRETYFILEQTQITETFRIFSVPIDKRTSCLPNRFTRHIICKFNAFNLFIGLIIFPLQKEKNLSAQTLVRKNLYFGIVFNVMGH